MLWLGNHYRTKRYTLNMENRIRIQMMGLSYNPLQNGAFALLLSAEGTNKRIPVIIGAPEAQAIAIALENITPPRPMTHDLFVSFAGAFGVELKEVFIYNFEDGIFSSEMTFSDGERTITLDSRTSDAIAVAIRTGAPIFTTPAILDETGIEITETESLSDDDDDDEIDDIDQDDTDDIVVDDDEAFDHQRMTIDELRQALDDAVSLDKFEDAARIQRLIDRLSNREQ